MSKELESLNIRKAENGYTISANYRETEIKKPSKEAIVEMPHNKDYVCETSDKAVELVREFLSGKSQDAKSEIKDIYKKAKEAEQE